MLALFDEATGLDGLLDKFDFDGAVAWSLDRIFLGQPSRDPRPPADTDPVAHAKALLMSNGFRQFVLRAILDAFPEKPRVLFVHVPKCAGTDLRWVLEKRYFSIDGAIENPGWYTPERRLQYLGDIVKAAPFVDRIFVRGHVPLRFYVNQGLVRPGDDVFTVVRDPVDVLISMINYVLTRFRSDPTGTTPDTRQWLSHLGMPRLPPTMSGADWGTLARRILREKRIVTDNILCNALGRGDAASSLEFMIASDIEVTNLPRYEPWLAQRWGVPKSERANESFKFVTRANLAPDDMDLIMSKVTEDRILYDRIQASLDAVDTLSIRGRVLG